VISSYLRKTLSWILFDIQCFWFDDFWFWTKIWCSMYHFFLPSIAVYIHNYSTNNPHLVCFDGCFNNVVIFFCLSQICELSRSCTDSPHYWCFYYAWRGRLSFSDCRSHFMIDKPSTSIMALFVQDGLVPYSNCTYHIEIFACFSVQGNYWSTKFEFALCIIGPCQLNVSSWWHKFNTYYFIIIGINS